MILPTLLLSLPAPAVPAQSTAAGALAARLAQAEFVPIPGVREASARLIVRPRTLEALLREGVPLPHAWTRRAEARKRLERHEILRHVPQTGEYVLRLREAGSEEREALALLATGEFEYAEPDWLLAPCAPVLPSGGIPGGTHAPAVPVLVTNCPDDTSFASQWHHQPGRMNSCQGWNFTTGAPGASIGICDTGLRATHEDLQLHRLEGYNAVDRLWESQGGQTGPVYHHGTRTTGTAAANGDNARGVAGAGWNLGFRMLRVSNQSNGYAYLSDLQHAARTSIESGDRVANVSYEGVASASNLPTASYIKSIGGLLVWAAGNSGGSWSFANRDADDLIVVGATDANDALAGFSNYGSFVDLVAPGVGILTCDSAADNAYASANGTSFAAPLVSGVCAMIWSLRPWLSPSDVELILKAGVKDLGAPGVDDVFGYGRVDLPEALARDGSTVPLADFAAQPLAGLSPLVVDFRDLSTGVPTSWAWDFGDGSTSTQRNPSHVYGGPGARTVTLTVANAHGTDTLTRAAYVLVDVIPPVAAFAATPVGGLSPLQVSFTDQSSGGVATAWSWTFGDGTGSTLQHPTHVYTTAGFFTVSLAVSNAYGSDSLTKTNLVAVDFIPPVAGFSAQPTSGASPYVVHFSDESTGGVTTAWAWTFGDGGTSTAQDPQHTYTVPGTYTVRLVASNAYGSDDLVRTNYIFVGAGSSILADFVGAPTSGTAPLQVQFTDLSVGNIVQWEWDFGDGTTSSLQNPTHVYATPGDYDVSLQVTNPGGQDDQLDRVQYILVQ